MNEQFAWESLCKTCRKLHEATGHLQEVDIGTISELLAKTSCCICRLVLRLLLPKASLDDSAIHEDSPSPKKVILRKMGRSGFLIWYHSVIWGELNYSYPEEDLESQEIWWMPFKNSTRGSPDELDYRKVRVWITACDKDHVECYKTQIVRSRRTLLTDTWFIDTFENCLVYKDTSERFIALSYVWSNAAMFKTTTANLNSLQLPGAFLSLDPPLNAVVQDAIKVSRSLGERYLWVDALCIVQDDEVLKAHLITRMDAIYTQASLTIIAASGDSADAHLAGVWPDSRQANIASVEIVAPKSAERVPSEWIVVRPTLDTSLSQSLYQSRGWTFQEIYLSRRCLIFTKHGLFFRCDSALETDAGTCGHSEVWPEKNILTPLFNAEEHPLTENDQFNVYTQLVYDFSNRNLTYPSDSLRAINGILSMLSNQFRWRFIAGMPSHLIHQALLWRPMSRNPMRNPNFPSWSWAGWSSQLHWFFYSFLDPYWVESDIRELSLVPIKSEMEIVDDFDPAEIIEPDADGRSPLPLLRIKVDLVPRSAFQFKQNEQAARSPSTIPLEPSLGIWTLNGIKCGILFDWKDEELEVCSLIGLSRPQWTEDVYSDDTQQEQRNMRIHFDHICDEEKLAFSNNCFINIMLVAIRDGMTERIGIGMIHADVWSEVATEKTIIDLQ